MPATPAMAGAMPTVNEYASLSAEEFGNSVTDTGAARGNHARDITSEGGTDTGVHHEYRATPGGHSHGVLRATIADLSNAQVWRRSPILAEIIAKTDI